MLIKKRLLYLTWTGPFCKMILAVRQLQWAQLAQLVEQRTENPRVSGSIPELGICGCSSMVEHQPSKLNTWVRFPSPAFIIYKRYIALVYRQNDGWQEKEA